VGGLKTYRAMSLTRVTVGRSGSRLCVNFHAKGPLAEPAFYELAMAKAGSHFVGSGLVLQVWVQGGMTRVALLPGDVVRAQTQRRGRNTSVVIDRSEFPAWWPFTRFEFYAMGFAKGAPTAPFQQYSVTIPRRPPVAFPR
jgi:hypothetical protein